MQPAAAAAACNPVTSVSQSVCQFRSVQRSAMQRVPLLQGACGRAAGCPKGGVWEVCTIELLAPLVTVQLRILLPPQQDSGTACGAVVTRPPTESFSQPSGGTGLEIPSPPTPATTTL